MWWLIGFVIFLALYLTLIRPWQLRWGATDEEVARVMPGDDVVLKADFNATRAVTVNAPPEAIWPWLAQIGNGRAGWYSYDWIDNFGRPSATTLLPEHQERKAGDLIPLYKDWGFYIKELSHASYMVWWWGPPPEGRCTWTWGLYPDGKGATRLITRVRLEYKWTELAMIYFMLMDVGDIIMMRRCLLNIKARAERLALATKGRAG